jgi:hypothetical protein
MIFNYLFAGLLYSTDIKDDEPLQWGGSLITFQYYFGTERALQKLTAL